MSTFYSLRNPMTKKEMKNIGVKFQDGILNDNPKTWIVEKKNTNYIHPHFTSDDKIHGFTRYAGNSATFLLDIIESNGIDYCSEYDLDDCYPMYEIAEELGINIEDDEDLYDDFTDIFYDSEWYALDYYWAQFDGKADEFIKEWCKENKTEILSNIEKIITK